MDKFSRDTLQKTMQFLSLKGYKVITEFALPNKKRVDIIALNLKKEILIIEVKSNTRDIKLDKKWKNYLKYCNYFYFACSEKLKNHNFSKNIGIIENNTKNVIKPTTKIIQNHSDGESCQIGIQNRPKCTLIPTLNS